MTWLHWFIGIVGMLFTIYMLVNSVCYALRNRMYTKIMQTYCKAEISAREFKVAVKQELRYWEKRERAAPDDNDVRAQLRMARLRFEYAVNCLADTMAKRDERSKTLAQIWRVEPM